MASEKKRNHGRSQCGPGGEERVGVVHATADDQRHCDRLAEGAAHGQSDGRFDARAGSGDDGPPHDLPPGAPQGERSLPVGHRHPLERRAGERDHGRQHHDREHHRGQENARSEVPAS